MLVPEIRGASLEIILATHLNEIRDPRPHNIYIFAKLLLFSCCYFSIGLVDFDLFKFFY